MADTLIAKMKTNTLGTGTITLEALTGFLTFAQAGITNGERITYIIESGILTERGYGRYTSSGLLLSRDTVISSNTSGKINLVREATVSAIVVTADPVTIGTGDNSVADNAVIRADGTTGLLQDSGVTIDDAGVLTATAGLRGPLSGNVTGDVTGDVTGNVTGDVVGNISSAAGTLGISAAVVVEVTGNTTVDGRVAVAPTETESNPSLSIKEILPYVYQIVANTALDDLTASVADFSGDSADTYMVEIDATAEPDTFKWKLNDGAWTENVAITGNIQNLSNGVSIAFAATTGHTLGDNWLIEMAKQVQPALAILDSSDNTLTSIGADGVIFPVQAATASQPAYVKGGIYFDTTTNKLMVGGATDWEEVTSAVP